MSKFVADTCTVTCENNGKTVKAEILEFKEQKWLSVSLNRTLKLNLTWNNYIYEGHHSGMSFTSTGPTITQIKEKRNA
jgi:hypothetical protein